MTIRQTLDSYELHLLAENKSPKTIRCYTDAVRKLTHDGPVTTRQEIERHIAGLLARYSPGYASNQFRALQQFFKWLAAEEDIPNPMAGMKVPQAQPKAVPVFADGEIEALIRACRGRGYRQRRDTAILMLFRDTGCRLSELAGLTRADLDMRQREALVTGKGNRQRVVKFGAQTAVAIDRYLRMVSADGGPLFGLLPNGIYQMCVRRGAQAGVRVHPHKFRHHFSHTWLDRGGAEGDLMQLNGWRSAQMLRRYGASAASSRARRSYDRIMFD